MKIRVSEMFYSFQGEALYAGKPSAWIRFFGCNLECNGFGQIHSTNPEGNWVHPVTGVDSQLCFTGGEPMMWQKAMEAIVKELVDRNKAPKLITIETNATKPIQQLTRDMIHYSGIDFHFAMSPKLFSVSGEKDAVKPEIIASYIDAGFSHVVKFVANGSHECWEEIDDAVDRIKKATDHHVDFWIMPVGATKDQQEHEYIATLSVEAMKRGFNVATRNHCYVFGNVIGK